MRRLRHSLIASGLLVACGEPPVLEQLPLSAALDYVQRHPEYVIADPIDAELIDSERPSPKDAKLDRHLAGDWVARQLPEYSAADVEDRIRWARRSVEITRETMVSQRQPGIYMDIDDCVCERGFDDAAFAHLVRGISNCDGMNHVLAMLLHVREPNTRLYHLEVPADGDSRGGHTLAVMPGRDGSIFVDAWANFGVMVLSETAAPGVPTWDALMLTSASDDEGLYARDHYERSDRVRKTWIDYGQRHDEGPDLRIPSDLPPITDARDAYLRARVFDLYGLEDEALPLYEQAAEMACVNPAATVCQLARVFIARAVVLGGDGLSRPESESPAGFGHSPPLAVPSPIPTLHRSDYAG
jgi:hypothetical protein